MFHISMGTLRHYEQIGLLKPEYTDTQTGYRYYGIRQLEVLNTIRYMRLLDMPLSEIKTFLNNRDPYIMEKQLLSQKRIIEKKQHELENISRKIDHRLSTLHDALHSELDQIKVIQSPSIRFVSIKDSIQPRTYLDLEVSIRKLVENQAETMVFIGKIGVGINKEKLIAHQLGTYDLVYMILDDEDEYQGEVQILPPSLCLTLRFCGTHKESPHYYEKLFDYMEEHQYQINGFSREITLIDNGLTSDPHQFVTEITIPISKES